jgi:hypothetical protein
MKSELEPDECRTKQWPSNHPTKGVVQIEIKDTPDQSYEDESSINTCEVNGLSNIVYRSYSINAVAAHFSPDSYQHELHLLDCEGNPWFVFISGKIMPSSWTSASSSA